MFVYIDRQDPQCEGFNKYRILFDSKAPSPGRVFHVVTSSKTGSFQLDAGDAHGITTGALFTIYPDKDLRSESLGVLVVHETTAFTAHLTYGSSPSDKPIVLPPSGYAYALQTRVGVKQELRIFIADDERLLQIYSRVVEEMNKVERLGRRGITPIAATDLPLPDMALVAKKDKVAFEINNETCRGHGITQLYHEVPYEVDRIFPVICSAADFHFHLNRSTKNNDLTKNKNVRLEAFELQESWVGVNCVMMEKNLGRNLITNAALNVFVGDEKIYGYKVINDTDAPLYAALFYFDMSDLGVGKPNIFIDGLLFYLRLCHCC